MRLDDERESDNVEDVRGSFSGRGAGIGCGGVLIALLIAYLTGQDPGQILQLVSGIQEATQEQAPATRSAGGPPSDALGKFASVVLASTEDAWGDIFAKAGQSYRPPKLVLFTEAVQSACGMSSSATGPFYCPGDQKVYLDLSFFQELSQRFQAPGDFAQAYVIAHEVGHHVQNLLGVSDKVTRAQQAARSEAQANALSVRLELQADCLAGVWATHANQQRHILEPGDVEEGLRAAAAIGDDRLQRMSRGSVAPDSFTHGSSEQRVESLRRGVESGDPNACKL